MKYANVNKSLTGLCSSRTGIFSRGWIHMVTHLFNGKFLIQLLCKFQVAAAEADPIFAVVLCRLMMRQQRDQADATLYFYLFLCSSVWKGRRAWQCWWKRRNSQIQASKFLLICCGGVFGLFLTRPVYRQLGSPVNLSHVQKMRPRPAFLRLLSPISKH